MPAAAWRAAPAPKALNPHKLPLTMRSTHLPPLHHPTSLRAAGGDQGAGAGALWVPRRAAPPAPTPPLLHTRAQPAAIRVPVQAHFGALDALQGFSDPPSAAKVAAAMKAAGCDVELFM